MSRLNKSDAEHWLSSNILIPKKLMYVNGEVDEDMAELVIKGLIILDMTKPEVPIQMWLNSSGGDCTQGMAIYDAIRNCQSQVDITVFGECYSMATWILQAADRRILAPHSRVMIHVGEYGLSSDHPQTQRAWIRQYERDEEQMIEILYNRMRESISITPEQVEELLTFDKIYEPEEAVRIGLADEILGDTE
jgi:ATP-dependent Clp protease protease subunit